MEILCSLWYTNTLVLCVRAPQVDALCCPDACSAPALPPPTHAAPPWLPSVAPLLLLLLLL